jgi:two-component system response regulator PilR (NtrC family)
MAVTPTLKKSDRSGTGLPSTVLVVDDEADIRELLELTLIRMGLGVDSAGSVAEAKRLLGQREYDLCLTDMRLPDGEGIELVRHISAACVDTPVAVITAYGSTESAVAALKAGAFDYLSKPIALDQLRSLIKSALSLHLADKGPGSPASARKLLGDSPPIVQVRAMIEKLSRSQAPVYISGESGTGKELAARLIHDNGARRAKPFVPVNCGAIPENLMESEFFGYKKGAFTGAEADRDGFFQAASGGTLFLDEVADLPLSMQVKLLRAIQEKSARKVGATTEDAVDVRVICATHQNLAACVEAGKFRQDLYYRLNVIGLHLPPLRECREDVQVLSVAILGRLAEQAGARAHALSKAAVDALHQYDFPGNARELENILERAVALAGTDQIEVADLQLVEPVVSAETPTPDAKWPLQDYLDRLEREAILEALGKTRFNRTAAAKVLGITFRALRYRMERLDIR